MVVLSILIKIIVAGIILNVWLFRKNRPSPFRGGNSISLKEEFSYYGLPNWIYKFVGVLKVSLALLMLASIFWPQLTALASLGLALCMLGAVSMHLRVKDNLTQTWPAVLLLILCLSLLLASHSVSNNLLASL